jgi:predicted  nucleic acid-binding Zn-ribbon protein
MVQTDLTQLNRECNSWRDTLRTYRTDISSFKTQLQDIVNKPIPRSELAQVEHIDNQIDIQLKNINQLKHEIKDHERNAAWELGRPSGVVSEATLTHHEALQDRYEVLEHTLSELKNEFTSFAQKLG